MTNLGEIELYGPKAYLEAREKLRLLLDGITGDDIFSARIAAAVSVVCRRLYLEGDHPRLSLELIEDHSGGLNLVVSFRGWSTPKQDGVLKEFFETVSADPSGDGIRAIKKLPSRSVDEQNISASRKIIEAKGRDQLMRETQAQNLELERHRNQLEETVRQRTEELEEAMRVADNANKAKSAFLANMSHELRTPMNAILGFAEMLAEDAEEEGNENQLADIKEIIDSGEHLLSLLNDVLDISKIEAGRMDLYLETFDLTTMMGEVASTTKALVDKNKNAMEVSIADDLGEMHADVTKVRQVLFNLMSNAAKFTTDGTITLFGERRAKSGGDIIRLGVSDTGIGIPEDKLDHIFEEFSQADDSTTKNFGGTGLGLALVRRFCQMMGGDIWAESTPDEGSSFILELPATVVEQEEGQAEEQVDEADESSNEETSIPGSGSVLVIDDDRSARELIKRSLESEGHSVTVAEGGDEGIALARSLKPSLITLDVLMPGRDGWSVLQELKADPDLRDIPVVMVSMIDDNKMGSALGAVDHLSKPVDRNKLKALVKRYSAKGRALVIEDEDAAREVVVRALESIGWKAVEAENGAFGIEKFGNGNFDLIILDIMMPVMDGFGFIKELRLTEKGRSVPIVVLTAKDLTKAERKELNGNVEEIFLKEETSIEELVMEIGNKLSPQA